MKFMICTSCGKAISEKATKCPHCNADVFQPNFMVCEDCKQQYDAYLMACPNCGCPNSSAKKPKKKRMAIIVSVAVCALIVIIAFSVGIFQKAKEFEYYRNMEAATYTMLDGAAKAETTGNLIKSVWYNAIYEEHDDKTDRYTMKEGKFVEDFNDALDCLFEDEDFNNSLDEIEDNQSEVLAFMKQLKNPPEKYEEAYAVLQTYYYNYLKMTNAVLNPTGSLTTFSDDFRTYDKNTVDSYDKMKLYLE